MQRRLAAIVHADLAGFTRMMEGSETRTFRHLKSAQIDVWRPAIDAASGRLVGTAGDAMLADKLLLMKKLLIYVLLVVLAVLLAAFYGIIHNQISG